MTTNIIIGKKSFVTKSLLKYLNKAEVFSANNLNETSIGEICLRKKNNIIFNNFFNFIRYFIHFFILYKIKICIYILFYKKIV